MIQFSRPRRWAALLSSGVTLAGAVALAGCGSGAASAGTAAAASGTPDDATMAIVTCYRTHGDPSFPDPVYDPGDGDSARGRFTGQLRGVIRPLLDWSVERLD